MNIQTLQLIFGHTDDLVVHRLTMEKPFPVHMAVLCFQTLVDMFNLSQTVLEPLLSGVHSMDTTSTRNPSLEVFEEMLITAGQVHRVNTISESVAALLHDSALLLIAGCNQAITLHIPRQEGRSVCLLYHI